MGEGVDLDVLLRVLLDALQACERVDSVDVHRARSTDALSARATEGERRVDLVLDLQDRVEDHRSALGEVNVVRLEVGLLRWVVGVLNKAGRGRWEVAHGQRSLEARPRVPAGPHETVRTQR